VVQEISSETRYLNLHWYRTTDLELCTQFISNICKSSSLLVYWQREEDLEVCCGGEFIYYVGLLKNIIYGL
jgi:hypothetical protein